MFIKNCFAHFCNAKPGTVVLVIDELKGRKDSFLTLATGWGGNEAERNPVASFVRRQF